MNKLIETIFTKVAVGELDPQLAHLLIKQYEAEEQNRAPIHRNRDIAVIGMACRFPVGNDPQQFWQHLDQGSDGVREIPEDRWPFIVGDAYNNYCRWGGFLDSYADFDPEFFGENSDSAARIDPQQRLLLQICWELMEHSGYGARAYRSDNIGVFIGARGNTYKIGSDGGRLLSDGMSRKQRIETVRATVLGQAPNLIAAAVSQFLDLKGPAMVVDTACSSSLVSTHLAMQSLLAGECEMAISGGVDLLLTPDAYIYLSQMQVLSPDGKCHTFDRQANGYVPGEGAGAILLKPLSQAIADGDSIYAVIKGSALNNDGYTIGGTTPDVYSQQQVIHQALRNAGVSPETITLLEAHGTGTFIGDPIEIMALSEVYRQYTANKNYCALGAVKTNIGHLHSAAGIASILKVVLALYHRRLPRTLHCDQPNPRFNLIDSPFYICSASRFWEELAGTRRAGVSAFGFGGTNGHIILEQAPAVPESQPAAPRLQLLTLSARDPKALVELATRYRRFLNSSPEPRLDDCRYTANIGRESFAHRLAICCRDNHDLDNKLSEVAANLQISRQIFYHQRQEDAPVVAFLFPGQGSQYFNMCRELYQSESTFRTALQQCDRLLAACGNFSGSLLDYIYAQSNPRLLDETAVTQPAVFAVSYALAQMWLAWGVRPKAVMGHSVGEYVAACLAGVLSLEDAILLISERGRLMQALPAGGAMAVVMADADQVSDKLARLGIPAEQRPVIAAINSPVNTVVAGEHHGVNLLLEALRQEKIASHKLAVSHAFHSPLMEPMLDDFVAVLDTVCFQPPQIPIVSNVTGEFSETLDADYWLRHIRQPVQFAASVRCLLEEECDILLEVGPGTTLLSMIRQIATTEKALACPSLDRHKQDWQALSEAAGKLWVRGVALDIATMQQVPHRRIALPTYPFAPKPYLVPQRYLTELWQPVASAPRLALLGERLEHSRSRSIYRQRFFLPDQPVLAQHRVHGNVVVPGVCYWEMARIAAQRTFEGAEVHLQQVLHLALLSISADTPTRSRVIVESNLNFAIETNTGGDNWQENARGLIEVTPAPAPPPPPPLDLASLKSKLQRKWSGTDSIYRHFAAKGLDYGPAFRAITAIWADHGQALVQLELTEANGRSDAFCHHPALVDGALQGIIAIAALADDPRAFVPFFVEKISYWGTLPRQCYGLITLQSMKPHNIRMDVTIAAGDGEVKMQISGINLKPVAATAKEQAAATPVIAEGLDDWFTRIAWQHKPLAGEVRPEAEMLLVFTDSSAGNRALVKALVDHGYRVIEVYPQDDSLAGTAGAYRVAVAQRDDYQRLWQDIRARYPQLRSCIHLWNCSQEHQKITSLQELQASQYLGFYSLLFLIQAMTDSPGNTSLRLLVAASQVHRLDAGEGNCPEKATLLGLVKSVAWEYPHLCCSLVDIASSDCGSRLAAQQLIAELGCERPAEIVAYRHGRRYLRTIEPIEAAAADGAIELRQNGCYLIVGGLGGIGLEIARYLGQKLAAKIAIIQRSPFPERDSWDNWSSSRETDAGIAHKISVLQEIEAAGGTLLLLAGDISDLEQMQRCRRAILQKFSRIDGVIHAAGVLQDALIRNSSPQTIAPIFAAKVAGTWVLDQVYADVDFLLLFSGLVTYFGNTGQCAYTAASCFQDALAGAGPGQRRTMVINWSVWQETGLATRAEVVAKIKSAGIEPITSDIGVQALAQALQWGHCQTGIGRLSQQLRQRGQELDASRSQPLPAITAAKTSTPQRLRKGNLETAIKNMLSQSIAAMLSGKKVKAGESFLELGLDSLAIIAFTEQLERQYQIKLYPTLFFDYSTIAELAGYLATNFAGQFQVLLQAGTAPTPKKEPAPTAAAASAAPEKERPATISNATKVAKPELQPPAPKTTAAAPRISVSPLPALHNHHHEADSHYREQELAIIGMAGVFPQARNVEEYWRNLVAGVDCVSEVGPERWDARSYYHPKKTPGKTYCKWAGFVDGVDLFDPLFFGISPREANAMDPQQRLFLRTVWETLEDAGYAGSKLANSPTGVFVGVSRNNYAVDYFDPNDPYTGLGISTSVVSNRVSYFMNFTGPSMTINTVCSSSLVALHHACLSIANRECDQAIAGGVHFVISGDYYVLLSQMEVISAHGRCMAFDKRADGFIAGEGAGAVLIKRLDDAIRDRDNIHAVIKISVVNHCGRSNSLSAPSVKGQSQLLGEAISRANIPAESIAYIEAHGTGTSLGDPIEVQALTKAFSAYTANKNFCALGSAKTNIGHLEAAAGIAGLIKAVLTLKHRTLVQSLHLTRPNPYIDFVGSPFYLVDKTQQLPPTNAPLRAGVSSFGMSGTNAHVILEEAPQMPAVKNVYRRSGNILCLSAKNADSLQEGVKRLQRWFSEHLDADLADVGYTLNSGRAHFSHRLALIADDSERALDKLNYLVLGGMKNCPGIWLSQDNASDLAEEEVAEITMLFPGEMDMTAIIAAGVGREVFTGSAVFAAAVAECEQAFQESGHSIISYFTSAVSNVDRRLLLLTLQYAFARLWLAWGLPIADFIGTKIGAYAAAVIAEAMPLASAAQKISTGTNDQAIEAFLIAAEKIEGRMVVSLAPPATSAAHRRAGLVVPSFALSGKSEWILLLNSLGTLYVHGAGIDWEAFDAGYQRRKLSLPTYAFNERRCWHQGDKRVYGTPALAPDQPQTSLPSPKASASSAPLVFFQPVWQQKPMPASPQLASQGVWLLFADTIGIARELAPQLQQHQQIVIIVVPGPGFSCIDRHHYQIDPGAEADYRSLLAAVTRDHGSLIGIIHLWSCRCQGEDCQEPALEVDFRHGIYSLFWLAKAIMPLAAGLRWLTISTDAYRIDGQPEHPEITNAPLVALTTVLAREDKKLSATSIDFASAAFSASAIAAYILQEITASAWAVAYRHGRRLVRSVAPLALDPIGDAGAIWRRDGAYLITGGTSGIGAELARYLAQRCSPRLALIGRTQLPPREQWHNADASVAAKIKLLQALEQSGSEVLYFAADVSRRQELAAVLSAVEQRWGKISGVLHCAGINDDAIITDKSFTSFCRVLEPKVQGGRWLLDLLRGRSLDFLVLFSSVGALFANPGQADYAVANAIIDAMAARGGQDYPLVAINWPYWESGGIRLNQLGLRKMEEQGMLPLSSADGIRALEIILAHQPPGNLGVARVTNTALFLEKARLLIEGTTSVAHEQQPPAPSISSPSPSMPGKTEAFLRQMFAKLLVLAPEEIDSERDLEDYGMDSLAIKDALFSLEQHYGQLIDPSIFQGNMNLRDLSNYLSEHYAAPALQEERAPVASTSAAPVADYPQQPLEQLTLPQAPPTTAENRYREILENFYHGKRSQQQTKEHILAEWMI